MGGQWDREEASPSALHCPQEFQERTVNREVRDSDNRREVPRERTQMKRLLHGLGGRTKVPKLVKL